MGASDDLTTLKAQIEEMWAHQNTLFEIINTKSLWDHKHGADSSFSDPPFHLAYCNHDLVARPIELGRDLPKEEQRAFASIDDFNTFNARKFAKKAPDLLGYEAWGMLKYSWEEISNLMEEMSSADLENPFWMSFGGGQWLTVRHGLQWILIHDWSEFMQLRIHMGRTDPVPSPAITWHYLASIIGGAYPQFLNPAALDDGSFTTNLAFIDPEVGAFALRVEEGEVKFAPGELPQADLLLTQSSETFEALFHNIQSVSEALDAGDLKASDLDQFEKFRRLFPVSI